MNLPKYPIVEVHEKNMYEFYSEGPKGRLRKAIRFRHIPKLGANVYNLAFGDYDAVTDTIDDKVVSNNGDGKIVLHTVADAIVDFLVKKPLAFVLIKGSSR